MSSELLSLSDALNRRFELPDVIEGEGVAAPKSEITAIVAHSFMLGDIGFLLPAHMVSEVVQDLPLCRLPQVPRWLWGMVNLRGNLLPIFDLRDLFGLGQTDPIHYTLLVLHIEDEMVGIVIDNLPTRMTLGVEHKLKGQAPLPELLQTYSRTCYKINDRIWVDWNVEGFFTSLSKHW